MRAHTPLSERLEELRFFFVGSNVQRLPLAKIARRGVDHRLGAHAHGFIHPSSIKHGVTVKASKRRKQGKVYITKMCV